MPDSIIQLTNASLNQKMTTPSVMVQFSPGQAVTVGHDLVLVFFIDRQFDESSFHAGCPDEWTINARLSTQYGSKYVLMRERDSLYLPSDNIEIWPVAFEIDIHSRQVRKILTRIATIDISSPIDNIHHTNF